MNQHDVAKLQVLAAREAAENRVRDALAELKSAAKALTELDYVVKAKFDLDERPGLQHRLASSTSYDSEGDPQSLTLKMVRGTVIS